MNIAAYVRINVNGPSGRDRTGGIMTPPPGYPRHGRLAFANVTHKRSGRNGSPGPPRASVGESCIAVGRRCGDRTAVRNRRRHMVDFHQREDLTRLASNWGFRAMAASGVYGRLVAWAQGRRVTVERSVNPSGSVTWSITVSISDPVVFAASGRGRTVEDAASEVVEQLESVGVDVP